jgi:hypothetical protein
VTSELRSFLFRTPHPNRCFFIKISKIILGFSKNVAYIQNFHSKTIQKKICPVTLRFEGQKQSHVISRCSYFSPTSTHSPQRKVSSSKNFNFCKVISPSSNLINVQKLQKKKLKHLFSISFYGIRSEDACSIMQDEQS